MNFIKKILIADDHAIFREGLKQVIAKSVDMTVADEVESGHEVLRKIKDHDYDLIILDISMPGRSGLDVLTDIKKIKPKIPVLILSMYPEEQYALRAFKAGASGYMTKGSAFRELLEALQKIALGKRYISAALAEVLAEGLGMDSDQPLHERLSQREYQIMCMIAAGHKPLKIAQELAMSVKTVGTYRFRILKKMNMKSNVELTRYAMETGLV
jgi:DNA-binding NarL/FixJ family response regulator